MGPDTIDIGAGPVLIATPIVLHHKADGATTGASFAFEMIDQQSGQFRVVAEVSVAMLQRAVAKLGYQLVGRKDVQ